MAIKPVQSGKTDSYTEPNVGEPRGTLNAPTSGVLIKEVNNTTRWEMVAMGGLFANHNDTPLVITGSGAGFVPLSISETEAAVSFLNHNIIAETNGDLTCDIDENSIQHFHIAATIALDRLGGASFESAQIVVAKFDADTEEWAQIPHSLTTVVLGSERVASTALHADQHFRKGDKLRIEVQNLDGSNDLRLWNFYIFMGGMIVHDTGN